MIGASENINKLPLFIVFMTFSFFPIWVFFKNIQDLQDSRGRGAYLFNSPLPLPAASQTLGH